MWNRSHRKCILLICCYCIFVPHSKVLSAPAPELTTNQALSSSSDGQETETRQSEPVWSHGESYSFAHATGNAVLETDSWTSVDNNGGLQVNTVMSDGTVIGYQVAGKTNCSQESYAFAQGAWSANAIAYGLCNSTVILNQPVSNEGVGR